MHRPGHTTLPSAYLLNHGGRRTPKTSTSLLPSLRSLTVCRVAISLNHRLSHKTHRILSDRSHVLYLPTLERFRPDTDSGYNARHKGLKLDFIVDAVQKKRVVRCWARRRVDQAVTEALRTRGFDRNGSRLVESDLSAKKGSASNNSPVNLTITSTPKFLVGTVDIHVLHRCIETSFTEVQRQAGAVVDGILETCGRYHYRG